MSRSTLLFVGALVLGIGIANGCGGGGGGGSSPFPTAVRDLFGPIDDALRTGDPDLPLSLTCGLGIGNPLEAESNIQTIDIAGVDDHSGTVAQVRVEEINVRDRTTGASSVTITVRDENDLSRFFLDISAQMSAPSIRFLAPPLGAKEFLTPAGTGQVFAYLQIRRTISWQRTFENNPTGTGGGTGTLVDFLAPPQIPTQLGGPASSKYVEEKTYLVEFDVTAGPPTNTACVVGIDGAGEEGTNSRTGSGMSVSPIRHVFDAFAVSSAGPLDAFANRNGVVAPVGPDPVPGNPVADGDTVHLVNGVIKGGIAGYNPLWNESRIDDANGTIQILDDGVPDITDGDFDGVAGFSIDGQIDMSGVPGDVGNQNVEVSVLTLRTSQLEDPRMADINHPLDDIGLYVYAPVVSVTKTSVIIYR